MLNSFQRPSCVTEPAARAEKWTLEAKLCLHKQVQGDEG